MEEDFAERMGRLAETIASRAANCRSEEQTKQSLIQPVIHALGYDIFNPDEVIMEYACDAPVLKSRNGKPESVDYAIRIDGTLSLLIEAKDASENLDRHGGQLARYFMSTECRHAILTNGIEWRFFSDLDRDNVMDAEPYRTIRMSDLSGDDVEFLSGFRKERFSEGDLRSEAEKVMYAAKISDYIMHSIIDNMSDEIVRVILGHVYDGVKSAAVVARFRPMISEEFDKCVAEKYAIRSSLVRKTDEVADVATVTVAHPDGTAAGDTEESPARTSLPAGVSLPFEVSYASVDGSYDAKGLYLGGNRMTVLAGSEVAVEEKPYIARNAHDLREKFVADGIVTEDVTFDSASTAGAFVNGGVCDAGRCWRVADGRSLLAFLGVRTLREAAKVDAGPSGNLVASGAEAVTNAPTPDAAAGEQGFPIFMRTRVGGTPTSYDATATYLGDKRCRLAVGSQCATRCDSYASPTTRRLRDEHLDGSGIVVRELEGSVSMVGTVVTGSTCDGPRRWKLADGRELREAISADDGISPVVDTDGASHAGEAGAWPVRMSYASTERAANPFSATARIYEDGTTIVEGGSVISGFTAPSLGKQSRETRERVMSRISPDESGRYVLADDQEVRFASASGAACFVCGFPINGNDAWRDESGHRLRDMK